MEGKITDYFKPGRTRPTLRPLCSVLPPLKKPKRPVGRPRKRPLEDDAEVQLRTPIGEERGEGSSQAGPQARNMMYSAHQKKKIANYARLHGVRPAARQFGVHRRNVGRWLKENLDAVKGKKQRRNKKGQGRKLSYPVELDEQLLQWVLEKRDLQLAISTEMLKLRAKLIITPVNPDFKASDGWAQKFFHRHSLVLRAKTSLAQKLPCDLEEKIKSFHEEVYELRMSTNVAHQFLGNMDETPVYFDIVPGRTIERRGQKSVKVRTTGLEKRHITVVLGCTATGIFLPPMIIFKGKTDRTTCNLKAPEGFIIVNQEKAWMDMKY